ncbi:MAG: DUF1330 domain-containing protein [Pseudomonadota bacterium]
MTTYAIAHLTVTNPESLAAYRDKAGAALAKHGGAVVQASSDFKVLEGAPDLPTAIAVLSFPDQASAFAWKNDESLQDVHALRMNSGKTEIVCL